MWLKNRARNSSIEVIDEEREDLWIHDEDQDNPAIKSEQWNDIPNVENEIVDESISKSSQITPSDPETRLFKYETEDLGIVRQNSQLFEEMEREITGNEKDMLDIEYFKNMRQGLIYLQNGINDVCIPVNKEDIGSIIAYSLNTNPYYEGLIRQNYMEFQSKIEQNPGEDRSDSKIFSALRLQNQLSSAKPANDLSKSKKDRARTNHKIDVLNSEYLLHHIESEFLTYEKINFKLKWSTSLHDIKMKVFKNSFKVDHIHGNHQELSNQFLNEDYVLNNWADLNEVKRMIDLFNSQRKNTMINDDQQYFDNVKTGNVSPLLHGLTLNKVDSQNLDNLTKNLEVQSTANAGASVRPRLDSVTVESQLAPSTSDLVITPSQPPIKQITEKDKRQKVIDFLNDDLEFEVTIYFPKKFEALRRFYWGSHEDFIKSIMTTTDWADNSGGKRRGKFFKSGDEKYVFKEIKNGEMRMFTEFAPRYFDYLCKSFFHNFPCALAKILGAYKISIRTNNNKNKISEKYYVVSENLNYGITNEKSIIRYDLKGSTRNRFIKVEDPLPSIGQAKVLLDTNFLLDNHGRPIVLK